MSVVYVQHVYNGIPSLSSSASLMAANAMPMQSRRQSVSAVVHLGKDPSEQVRETDANEQGIGDWAMLLRTKFVSALFIHNSCSAV